MGTFRRSTSWAAATFRCDSAANVSGSWSRGGPRLKMTFQTSTSDWSRFDRRGFNVCSRLYRKGASLSDFCRRRHFCSGFWRAHNTCSANAFANSVTMLRWQRLSQMRKPQFFSRFFGNRGSRPPPHAFASIGHVIARRGLRSQLDNKLFLNRHGFGSSVGDSQQRNSEILGPIFADRHRHPPIFPEFCLSDVIVPTSPQATFSYADVTFAIRDVSNAVDGPDFRQYDSVNHGNAFTIARVRSGSVLPTHGRFTKSKVFGGT